MSSMLQYIILLTSKLALQQSNRLIYIENEIPPVKPIDIAIKGAGPVGLVAAQSILHTNPNAKVTVFDPRSFTRRVQWSVRPSFFSTMSKLGGEGLAEALWDISTKVHRFKNPIPMGKAMLANRAFLTEEFASRILICDEMQRAILKELSKNDRFTFERSKFMDKEAGKFDVVVNAAGTSSQSEKQRLTTKQETHLSAVIKMNKELREGFMAKAWPKDQEGKTWIIGAQGKKDEMWIVFRVPEEELNLKMTPEEEQEHLKQLVIRAFEIMKSDTEICEHNAFDASYDIMNIYNVNLGERLQTFSWAPHVVNQATDFFADRPVVHIGDSVGNAHWSVGGGMQIGTVLHVQRLIDLLQNHISHESLEIFNQEVIEDTLRWVAVGEKDLFGEPIQYEWSD